MHKRDFHFNGYLANFRNARYISLVIWPGKLTFGEGTVKVHVYYRFLRCSPIIECTPNRFHISFHLSAFSQNLKKF